VKQSDFNDAWVEYFHHFSTLIGDKVTSRY
jgi:phosphoacetylglucosamine mutase